MKKNHYIIIASLLIILVTLISSCNIQSQSQGDNSDGSQTTSADAKIKELEAQIIQLMQDQQLSENEQKKEIAKLQAEIEQLRSTETQTESANTDETEKALLYIVENGKAIITSIKTNEESFTVPAVIDGYQVSAIGTDAVKSSSLEKLIISSGIEKIDWFAFRNCLSLSTISIPDSVTSIGYGAFDNTSKSLTINCKRDSFAHKYAQSYGITYDIT